MKQILLLSTGGTISCSGAGMGLTPQMEGSELLRRAGIGIAHCVVQVENLFSVDSTNIQPEHWLQISRAIWKRQTAFDGFVVAHGTDTLAYTAAMLSFLCGNLGKPVILTGSQRTFDEPGSDAPRNLRDAVAVACSGLPGVYVVFGGQIIRGTRAHKADTRRIDGFSSVNAPLAGTVVDGIVHTEPAETEAFEALPLPPEQLEAKILVVTVVPGMTGDFLTYLVDRRYDGVVLNSYGAGGLPEPVQCGWLTGVKHAVDQGVLVLMTTQCRAGSVDLSRYQVGISAAQAGAISAGDMTLEAAYTKLLWAFGLTDDPAIIRRLIETNYCGERMSI